MRSRKISFLFLLFHTSQFNQHKHKWLPPQIDFAFLQDHTPKPVHCLIKHEEVLSHQKHGNHRILTNYGTDQFPIRIINKGNTVVAKFWDSFFYEYFTAFQTKLKTPIKSITNFFTFSDDEDHIYTRIPKDWTPFTPNKTLIDENFPTLNKSPPSTFSTTNAFGVQTVSIFPPTTHKFFRFMTHLHIDKTFSKAFSYLMTSP